MIQKPHQKQKTNLLHNYDDHHIVSVITEYIFWTFIVSKLLYASFNLII